MSDVIEPNPYGTHGWEGPGVPPDDDDSWSDEALERRRAQIDVHCGGCGASFPGDTRLNNGLCRECCRSPVHLIRKVERYRKAMGKARGLLIHGQIEAAAECLHAALEGDDA